MRIPRDSRLPVLAGIVMMAAGCAPVRQGPFRLQLVPASAPSDSSESIVAGDAPDIPPNVYLAAETPKLLVAEPRLPPRPTESDLLVSAAEESFREGRRLYHAGKAEGARQHFDRAIDQMLEASARPTDRVLFTRGLDEMVDAIHRMDLAGLGAAATVEEPQFERSPLEEILEMTFPVDPKLKRKVHEELALTSSQLPLTVNDSVAGFIQYFSGRGRKTLINGLRRAGRYRPMIQRILAEEGVPPELIHLAQAESGFIPRAVSRMRATGMWQFVAFRGQEYGLLRTPFYDDRLDPEKSTRAAARHLRDLYQRYGDWYLAIAAYNCGPGGVDRAIERTGYADFWELRQRHALPVETTNYVPIILAMTILAKNAKEHGLEGVVPDPPIDYDVVETTSPTHLALAADLIEVPLSELQSLNPALLRTIAPAGYSLRVPRNSGSTLSAMLQTIPAERRSSSRMHRVGQGETMAGIARRYAASAASIQSVNNLQSDSPATGDRLLIPRAYPDPSPVVKRTASPGPRSGSKHRAAGAARASAARKAAGQRATKTSSGAAPRATHTSSLRAPRG